ncbi:MAG: hypothetical protein NZ522_06765, partial [Chitinophagales bacterium]|nr:hypothetical protein [Chitinophagales bacterium]
MKQIISLCFLLFPLLILPQHIKYPIRYYRALGIVNFYEKNFLAAANALHQALEIDPKDWESRDLLRMVYDSLGKRNLIQRHKIRNQSISTSFDRERKESIDLSYKNDMKLIANEFY